MLAASRPQRCPKFLGQTDSCQNPWINYTYFLTLYRITLATLLSPDFEERKDNAQPGRNGIQAASVVTPWGVNAGFPGQNAIPEDLDAPKGVDYGVWTLMSGPGMVLMCI